MRRRQALGRLAVLATTPLWLSACGSPAAAGNGGGSAPATPAHPFPAGVFDSEGSIMRLEKPREQWRQLLPPERFRILFQEGTEPPGSSPLDGEYGDGTYVCAACHLPLFDAAQKYDSGTGWPSFFDHLPGVMGTRRDFRLIWPRTEYHCIRCGGHQGHVFNDGPPPTGRRWCNNGLALVFVPRGEALPELRR